jgi:AsmA-like C-terminal region
MGNPGGRLWFTMRKALIWCAFLAVAAASAVLTLTYGIAPGLRETARRRTELYFQNHFRSTVQISDFRVLSLYPRMRVAVGGIVLRHEGRTDVPPLIEIGRATFEAELLSIVNRRPILKSVWLEGLQIRVPPRQKGAPPLTPRLDERLPKEHPVTIDSVHADDVLLEILPRDKSKQPREIAIQHLELGPLGSGRPAKFEATLTNPVPKGEIRSVGIFGPWNADDPAETSVSGSYLFQNADLGTLKGLSGTLSSTGRFAGPLDYLSVDGETDTPNFSLRTSNHPVPLHTDFSAIVDGTNGNTILEDVVARFLGSTLDVKGEVVDKTPKRGRTIVLDVASRSARVEDLLRLAVDSDPPVMTGAAQMRTRIEIGEGNADLIERMRLDGQFDVGEAQFTSPLTAQKIETLSLKGQGKPGESPTGDPVSEFKGKFRVHKGLVTFSQLSFGVTGAYIRLAGNYNLDTGDLDFRGKLRLQAKLSQTTTGVKSFFLKAIDPFFEGKSAGTVLPIKITGTKDQPLFGLDFHDKLNRD